jgi:hypothetical protein
MHPPPLRYGATGNESTRVRKGKTIQTADEGRFTQIKELDRTAQAQKDVAGQETA